MGKKCCSKSLRLLDITSGLRKANRRMSVTSQRSTRRLMLHRVNQTVRHLCLGKPALDVVQLTMFHSLLCFTQFLGSFKCVALLTGKCQNRALNLTHLLIRIHNLLCRLPICWSALGPVTASRYQARCMFTLWTLCFRLRVRSHNLYQGWRTGSLHGGKRSQVGCMLVFHVTHFPGAPTVSPGVTLAWIQKQDGSHATQHTTIGAGTAHSHATDLC